MNVVPIQQEIDLGTPRFEDFWLLWVGKKVKKKDAERLFKRLRDEQKMLAIIAAADWRDLWLEREEEFRPDPTRWIEGDRWEDELPSEYKPRHQAHQPMKREEQGPKSVMPEHVRALIAKLRGK